MGNYENLKQSITEVIRTNGNQEITGAVLQSTLLTIISTVGANATFAGIATPPTNPGTPDGPVFYLASESGTYSNFGSIELQDGLSVLMWNGSWRSQQILSIDDEPTAGSNNLVKSGGVAEEIALGAVYDVSAKNPTAGVNNDGKFESLSALLEDANLDTLIPTGVRKGGMTIKFVQISDNKYAQWRYMLSSTSNADFVNVANWIMEENEIDALYNYLSRNVKQKTSIVKTNNSSITQFNTDGIRANKFEGCFIGIRVYVDVKGQLEYGILEGNSYTVLDTVYVHVGANDVFFGSLQHCDANRHIYIRPVSCIVKATSNDGVGMYECLNNNTTFYAGWEIFYDAIESIGIEELKAVRGPQAILPECNYTSGKQYARANANTNNMNVKAIMVYANFDGVLDYGIMDVSDNNSIEKVGELQLTKGWNYKVLENIVETEDYTFLYVQPNSGNAQDGLLNMFQNNADTFVKAAGLYESPGTHYYNNSELIYYCIDERNQDNLSRYFTIINEEIDYCKMRIAENVPSLVSQYVSPTTPLSEISQYHNATVLRCNKLRADVVKGIRFYFNYLGGDETIEICKVNVSSNSIQLITSYTAEHLGVSDLLFDVPVSLGVDEYIGVRGSGSPSMGAHSEEGSVGMYELNNNDTFTFYPTFEIAYALITDIGCNVAKDIYDLKETVFSNFVDMKYGEILLPSEIEVANSRQCNLWWDSIANYLIGDKSVYFETHCSIGHNLERCYRIEGSEQAAGDYTLRIVSRKSITREVIDDKTVTIHVVNDSAGSGSKQILMIGDSRTWQNISTEQGVSYNSANMGGGKTITAEVKRLVDANGGATFTFLGTFVSPVDSTVKNLAQSGSTYYWANTQIGQSIVDYIENECGGTGLDYVTIMYGINDIEDWNNNQIGQYERSVAKITSALNYAKSLVDKILAGYPNCKIIMIVEPTTCGNQDGFGTWGQTDKDQHLEIEFAQKYLRKKFLETFDSHEYGNNVYVSSAGIWCDRLYGFPYTKQHSSSRASEKIVEYFRNSVHPHDDGYKQIADGIYSTIKYLEV